MEILMILSTLVILIFNQKTIGKYATPYNLIILPYIAIIVINNLIATRFGFIKIEDQTVVMIIIGSCLFFVGTIILRFLFTKVKKENKEMKVNIQIVYRYVQAVLILRIFELMLLIFQSDIKKIAQNDFDIMISRGFIGHLLISIFPFMPLLFYEWIQNKKEKKYIIVYLIYIILAFVETEKVQVIAPVIATFLYCVYKNEKYIKKGAILTISFIVILFISNYAMKFMIHGTFSAVDAEYYFFRLWNYIAGGLINSNTILDLKIKTDAFDYFSDIIFAFPNMITNRLFGFKLGADVVFQLPLENRFMNTTVFLDIYDFRYQTSNVYSTMTLMYGNGNIIAFSIVCIIWGFISEYFYMKMKRECSYVNIMLCCCYMTFSILSFFASYYTIASFLERLIWCILLCRLFVLFENIKRRKSYV